MIKEQKIFLLAVPVLVGMALTAQYLTSEGTTSSLNNNAPIVSAAGQRKSNKIVENLSPEQIKEQIWESSKELSSCMVEKKQMEESLSNKKDELASIDKQLEQAVSIDIFNKADWYNPISIYQEKKAKDKQIADIKEKKEQLSKEVSEIEAELTAKSEKCQSLQDDMEQLRQEISIAAPDTDINEILSGQDAEDINRIKSDKIDLFISENKGGAEDSSQSQLAGLPPFIIPVSDYVVTSDFGYRVHPIYGTEKFHSGTDLGVDYGTPVRASNYGKVVYAGWYSGFGNTVVLSHAEGVYTLYGHNEKVLVSTGDIVQQGQQIALAGSTGNSTGPHCHFSMWVNNQLVNPMDYVSK